MGRPPLPPFQKGKVLKRVSKGFGAVEISTTYDALAREDF